MTIEKIDAENKAAIFQALVDTVGESISVLTKIDLESTMLYLAGCLVVAVQEKMLKEGISTDTEMDITSESGASITLKNIDKFDYKGDSQEEAGSVSAEELAGKADAPSKKFFTVVYELNEANIDKHIKSLDWVAYIYTNLIPEDSDPLVLTPTKNGHATEYTNGGRVNLNTKEGLR